MEGVPRIIPDDVQVVRISLAGTHAICLILIGAVFGDGRQPMRASAGKISISQ